MPIKIISNEKASLLGPSDGSMTLTEFIDARTKFADAVTLQGGGAIEADQQDFLHTDLDLLVSVLSDGDERMVVIHLGLEGSAMRYGFSFRKATRNADELQFDEVTFPSHILENGTFRTINSTEWAPLHDRYREKVLLDRGTGNGPQLVTTDDAHAVVLPWNTEIDAMYNQTIQRQTGPFRLMLSSVSVVHDTSDGGPVGYRHGVSFHVEKCEADNWHGLLDDDSYVSVYRNRALDYGNLCPPRCRAFVRKVSSSSVMA